MAFGGPGAVNNARHTPGVRAVPNSLPAGSKTGAPPRTRFYSRPIVNGEAPTVIADGSPTNRTVTLISPLVGFNVFVGDSGVSAGNGVKLTPGIPCYVSLVGLQELYAVTDAPVPLPLQIQVAIVLMAEQERNTL